MCFRKAFSPDG
ncbi:hypothetical protein F383_17455 [Gossypium arboreum]|uniref:Uncharacterized protein n=1 Tax=Gossypium arboreum TaxID=29729 RepID=A0A0B0NT25_GOSAR|nr:hypothetical protein F383_17455 [Gossypium arboreum]